MPFPCSSTSEITSAKLNHTNGNLSAPHGTISPISLLGMPPLTQDEIMVDPLYNHARYNSTELMRPSKLKCKERSSNMTFYFI